MIYLYKGMAAGFAAAAVAAALLQINAETGLLPELDIAAMLADVTGWATVGGWILFFLIGALSGALFGWLDPDLPGDSLRQRGAVFAGLLWFMAMVTLLPLSGYGWFGLAYGILLPLASLALFLVFGAAMGGTYDWLLRQSRPLRYRLTLPAPPLSPLPARTVSKPTSATAENAASATQVIDAPMVVQSKPVIALAASNPAAPKKPKRSRAEQRRPAGAA